MVRIFGLLALVALLAPSGAAQQITNEPRYLGKEGASKLRRGDVRATTATTMRWQERPQHAFRPDSEGPRAWTEVVFAQWDEEVCVRKRGPFCTERSAWTRAGALETREPEVEEVRVARGNYLVFGRSRLNPSAPDAWKLDMLIADDPLDEPAGARRLLFDTGTSVGGGVRYSVVLIPQD